jgi:hypothetical protein
MMSDKMNDFLKWFNSPTQREDREKAMEMSGIPLEMRTRRLLTQLKYTVSRAYYQIKEENVRELDFLATKQLGQCPLARGQIAFSLHILGECKHSSTHDFFAFQAEQVENMLLLSAFPLLFGRETITSTPFSSVLGSLKYHFGFPFVTDRIVEVHAENYKTRKEENYGDEMTHGACEALLSASIHFKNMNQKLYDIERRRFFSPLQNDYRQISEKMPGATPRQLVRQLIRNNSATIWDDFSYFPVTFGVPMLVIDDNRGLVTTILRDDGSVMFKDDVGVVLYPYIPENIQQFQDVGAVGTFPVIICKYSSMTDAVKLIEDGSLKVIKQFEAFLSARPESLLEEYLVTGIQLQGKEDIF